jgi:hypothetical protein
MFAGVDSNPNSTTSMGVLKDGNTIKVVYSGLEERVVKVTIFNSKGKTVFQEEVRGHSSFIRPYNLVTMPEGEYRIVMNDGRDTYEEMVTFSKVKSEVLSSVIKSGKNKFVVTLYSAQETDVQIFLRDDSRNVLYSDRIKLKGGNARLFNLKNILSAVSLDVISEGSQNSITLK